MADFTTVVQATAQTESAVVLKRLQLNTMKTEQKYPRVACSGCSCDVQGGQEGPIWRAGAMQCVWLSSHTNSRLHWTLTSRPSWPGRAGLGCVFMSVCAHTYKYMCRNRDTLVRRRRARKQTYMWYVDEVHTRSYTCFLWHTPDFMSPISLKYSTVRLQT